MKSTKTIRHMTPLAKKMARMNRDLYFMQQAMARLTDEVWETESLLRAADKSLNDCVVKRMDLETRLKRLSNPKHEQTAEDLEFQKDLEP